EQLRLFLNGIEEETWLRRLEMLSIEPTSIDGSLLAVRMRYQLFGLEQASDELIAEQGYAFRGIEEWR
ncbi:MAG: hypothetical protein AAF664_10085, partial [Planctomycetota bacterium]